MITGGYIYSGNKRKLFALPIKFGGLGLPDYRETQKREYRNSREVTKDLPENVILKKKNFQIILKKLKK